MKIGEHETVLLGSTLVAVAKEVVRHYPDPKKLRGVTFDFSPEEEGALDSISGMMWPAFFADFIMEEYKKVGRECPSYGSSITFPTPAGDVIRLTFTTK